jgi:cytochrome c oxidase assembly factor CtaG
MIASHMSLSTADIQGGVTGLLILSGIILAIDALLCLISTSALEAVTDGFITFSVYMASFLVLSVFFVLLMILIAFAISRISALIARR